MKIIQADKKNIKEITAALENGAVLVLATDTVYGLVCDALNAKAVEKIFEIKKRDRQKPLGVFVKNLESAKEIAVVKKEHENFLNDNKITSILPAKNKSLSPLVYKNNTIGVRIPKYEFLNLVLNEFNKPIAQTSANISGEQASNKISDIIFQFKNEDILVIDSGDLPDCQASAIMDLTNNGIKIIRK